MSQRMRTPATTPAIMDSYGNPGIPLFSVSSAGDGDGVGVGVGEGLGVGEGEGLGDAVGDGVGVGVGVGSVGTSWGSVNSMDSNSHEYHSFSAASDSTYR